MSLPARRLGASGPSITCAGVGCWAMGGPWQMGWGPQDDEASVATIRAAVEAGVNWVDTAPIYGYGHSEEVVGQALKNRPDVQAFTKCTMRFTKPGEPVWTDLSPSSIRIECEQSLRRLGREHLDLLQLHFPDPAFPIEETWSGMAELKAEGKAKALGISNHTLDAVCRAHAVHPVDAVQLRLHLLDQRNLRDLLPWCADNGVGVIVYSPLASGLLTGTFDQKSVAEDDWRRRDERFLAEQRMAPAALEAIAELFPGRSPAEVALAWVVAQPGVTGVICGLRSPAEVPGMIRSLDGFVASDLDELGRRLATEAMTERPGWR